MKIGIGQDIGSGCLRNVGFGRTCSRFSRQGTNYVLGGEKLDFGARGEGEVGGGEAENHGRRGVSVIIISFAIVFAIGLFEGGCEDEGEWSMDGIGGVAGQPFVLADERL